MQAFGQLEANVPVADPAGQDQGKTLHGHRPVG
jgi:hypothetical protein